MFKRAVLALSLLSPFVAQAAAPKPKSRAPAVSVTALKMYRRIHNAKKRGVKLDDIKMPEASETLDFMLTALKKARAEHAPPKKDYKSPYLPGHEVLVLDLADRIDNPAHPQHARELQFMDTMIARGEALKQQGIPYRAFVDYSVKGWAPAMSLRLDPRDDHGDNARLSRDKLLNVNGDPEGWWSSWSMFSTGDRVWFPTNKSLDIADFNRLAPYRLSFIGLTEKVTWGDNGWWSPNEFALHDVLHGYAGSTAPHAVTVRYHKAIAKVEDPEVRHLLELNWFGNTHEAGDFKYDELDAETSKYESAKFAAAAAWLKAYRTKELAPKIAGIQALFEKTRAEAAGSNPTAVPILDALWAYTGGGHLTHENIRSFARRMSSMTSWSFGDKLDDHYIEVRKCGSTAGCTGLVQDMAQRMKEMADLHDVVPIERPFSTE